MNKLKILYRTLSNDIRGLIFEPSDWAEGYILRYPDGTAAYTIYCSDNGYSAYVAFGDRQGHDLADERPLCENMPVFCCVSRIKRHQVLFGEGYLYSNDSEEIDADLC